VNGKVEICSEGLNYTTLISRSSDFKGGRLYLICTSLDTCEIGVRFKFGIKLTIDHGTHKRLELSDTRDAVVVPPKTSKGEKNRIQMDAPNVILVAPGEELWRKLGWTDNDVAEVKEDSRRVDIYISLGNKWYMGAMDKAKYTVDYLEQFKWKYGLYLAFHVYLQHLEFKKTDVGIPEAVLNRIKQTEKERAARTVLTSITSEKAFRSSKETS
jgi:hypothetical protein